MRIFVTGGTGFIGSLVVEELVGSGHRVLGLARSDEAEQKLIAAGAEALRGTLTDWDVLREGATSCDGVIHMGFSNNFDQYDEAIVMDLDAVKVIGAALEGSGKPFVNTSGTLGITGLGRLTTEADLIPEGSPRGASEDIVIAMAAKGVRSSVVRLSPCVHDTERHGLVSALAQIAAQKRISAYIGEGTNRWPAVHRRDAAHLFCLALESAPAGTRLHAVAEEGIALKDIAEAIGQNVKVPVQSLSLEDAQVHFGFFAQPASIDNPSSAAATKKLLSWIPSHPTLLQDLDSFYRIKCDTEEATPYGHN